MPVIGECERATRHRMRDKKKFRVSEKSVANFDFQVDLCGLRLHVVHETRAEFAKVECEFNESQRIQAGRVVKVLCVLAPRQEVFIAGYAYKNRSVFVHLNTLPFCSCHLKILSFYYSGFVMGNKVPSRTA